jgi:DNA recombination protein RmuC
MSRDIFDTLGRVQEATGQVAEQAREFSLFQDMLRAPKLRGGVGEAMLEEMLAQVLPPAAYEIQHRFKTGATVDAAVRAGGRLVSIDAKFPLDNFRRMCDASSDTEKARAERDFAKDVIGHITAISTRYIIPDEDTLDFALMYLPAEGVYGEVLRQSHGGRPLYECALDARVIPVGPLTIYGYLQTLLFGLKCLRIETSAQDILDSCSRLQRDLGGFVRHYETLGSHIRHAAGKYEEARASLDRLENRMERMASLDDGSVEETDDSDGGPALEVVNVPIR